MRSLLACLAFILAFIGGGLLVQAAKSFAGANLYYAAGLSSSDAETLLSNMSNAGMKVLRVGLSGYSTSTTKGTTITAFNDLEPDNIGVYDDTVLNLLDNFMVKAHAHGIKLSISMHSWNSLSAGDVYSNTYGTTDFYESSDATSQFDNRLKHVLEHVHTTLNKPWKELSEYIFAFEAENEAMIGLGYDYIAAHQSWQCDRASTIKGTLGDNSGILVTTGGGSWLDESVMSGWLNCDALDIVAIHAYAPSDLSTSAIKAKVSQAQAAGKMLLLQEWAACYFDTDNTRCETGTPLDTSTRNSNIKMWASAITAAGVPWLYWQVLPNADPHYNNDFEIGIVDPSWSTLEAAALAAAGASSAFDYSANLLSSSASTAKSASIAASMNETQSSGGSRLALYGFLVFGVSLSFGYIFLLVL